MHESAVCREIMDITQRVALANDMKDVYEIEIAAGPYSCLQENQLNFIFQIARVGTCMEKAVIRVLRDESLTGASQMYIRNIRGE